MTLAELFAHTDICGVAASGVPLNFMILLTTGLLAGFSHCAGMCGPLVSTFVLHRRQQRGDVTSSLLTFQMGRLTTYALLGLLVGGLGALLRVQVMARGWQSSMSIIIGLLMLAAGLHLLGWLPIGHLAPAGLLQRVSGLIRRTMRQTHPAANFALGMSNALLPCAPVYTMLLLAATTGNPLRGGLAMFIFGLGTLPSMIGVGLFASRVSVQLRGHLFRAAAALIMLVGVQLMLRGLALTNQVAHFSVAGVMLW
ncbi:MAG: sulfite exporter TauE/SafE family protein [Caldilineaceae bacterium]